MAGSFAIRQSKTILARSCEGKALTGSAFLRMPGVNRQGQAHIVSTAILSPRPCKAGREVEATPWFRTWFSIDPQPASISPTINISIVFICAFLVDCGRIISHSPIRNDSSAIRRSRKGHRRLESRALIEEKLRRSSRFGVFIHRFIHRWRHFRAFRDI